MHRSAHVVFVSAALSATIIGVMLLARSPVRAASDHTITGSSRQTAPARAGSQTQQLYRSPSPLAVNNSCTNPLSLDVSAYSRIRVYFAVEQTSGSIPRTELDLWPSPGHPYAVPHNFLSITLQGKNRATGAPNNHGTATYEVPGWQLFWQVCARGSVSVFLWVYGIQ